MLELLMAFQLAASKPRLQEQTPRTAPVVVLKAAISKDAPINKQPTWCASERGEVGLIESHSSSQSAEGQTSVPAYFGTSIGGLARRGSYDNGNGSVPIVY